MAKLFRYLQQPYPFYYRGKTLMYIALLVFTMTLAFGYFFEPFAVTFDEHKFDYFWICFAHAIIPLLVTCLLALIPGRWTTEDHWSIGKEMLLISFALLLIGIGQFLIRDIIYHNPNNWSMAYLAEEIRNTFLVGTLFVIILVSANYNRLNSRYTLSAQKINTGPTRNNEIPVATVEIKTQVKKDDMTLEVNQLLYAKADGNYVTLALDGDPINKELKRITLKELEVLLKSYPSIMRTHRSYLTNLDHVTSVKGNAQGYQLQLSDHDESVPVARNLISEFDARMS